MQHFETLVACESQLNSDTRESPVEKDLSLDTAVLIADRQQQEAHVRRDQNDRSNRIPPRRRRMAKNRDHGVLLPEEMLQTLQMSKSRRRAGVHLENMTDSLVSHARTELLIEEKIVIIGILRAVGFRSSSAKDDKSRSKAPSRPQRERPKPNLTSSEKSTWEDSDFEQTQKKTSKLTRMSVRKRKESETLVTLCVDGIAVWARVWCLLCLCAVSHPQPPSFREHGVLWVSTGTHPYDDPPKQGGGPSERQLVPCAVACAVLSRERS